MEKSFYELWKLGINVIKTKIIFPKARLIRFPFDIRGKKYIKYGKNFTTGTGCRLEAYKFDKKKPKLEIGNNVQINDYVHLSCAESLIIGDNVLIASKVYITDLNHGSYSGEKQSSPQEIAKERKIYTKPVKIGNNVWIGENVSVLSGVEIGENAVLGANSVVTKDIPKNCIVAGNPAKVIKIFDKNTRKWEKI